MLKGDPAAEAQYADLSAKYLSKPLAMDGKTLPTMDEASEDLLWKSWQQGRECRFGFLIGSVRRELKLESQDGPTVSTLQIQLAVEDSSAAIDPKMEAAIKTMELAMLMADPAAAARMKMEIRMIRSHGQATKLASANEGGMLAKGDKAVARIGDKRYDGSATFWSGTVRVQFDGLPEAARGIDELTATLRLTQPLQIKEILVPLRKGATWISGGENSVIVEVTTAGGRTKVKCSSVPSPGKEAQGGHGTSSSSMGEGGDDDKNSDAPICLVAPDGRVFAPRGSSVNSINGNKTMEFTFIAAEKADRLRIRQTASLSIREVPLRIADIKLP